MSKLHIRGHYEWQGLNIEQKGQTINFWLTPPNEQVQPLVVTITRDDLVTTALYSLLAQALTNPKELPHWRATLTTPANFATKQSYFLTNGVLTVMFSYDAGPSLDIHVYSQVGKTSHHTHFTVVANILASNFIDDLAHALFLASQAQEQSAAA